MKEDGVTPSDNNENHGGKNQTTKSPSPKEEVTLKLYWNKFKGTLLGNLSLKRLQMTWTKCSITAYRQLTHRYPTTQRLKKLHLKLISLVFFLRKNLIFFAMFSSPSFFFQLSHFL